MNAFTARKIIRNRARPLRAAWPAAAVVLALFLGGCGFSESYQRGYVLPEGALEQIPVGAPQEQVLIVLGTPSTVATVSGEAFYYISRTTPTGGDELNYLSYIFRIFG